MPDPVHPRPHRDVAGFTTKSRVEGEIEVPRSKSIAQRAIVAALLAHGTTRMEGLPAAGDVLHAVRAARSAGARFPSAARPDDLLETALVGRSGFGQLVGVPPLGSREAARSWVTLGVGESGTAARLFTAALALARPAGSGGEIVPTGTLTKRSSAPLFEALRAAGVGVEHGAQPGGWPVLLTAASPPAVVELQHPVSSQEVSGLLIALAAHPEERQLRVVGAIPSRSYVDLTRTTLEAFGAFVSSRRFEGDDDVSGGEVFTVQGPLSAPDAPYAVEPDASSAAVALAAGALSGGARVSVRGIGLRSKQPDVAIVAALASFGCRTGSSDAEQLVCEGQPTQGGEFDCALAPDIAPVVVALGAFVAVGGLGSTTLTGLETLPGKESSRIEVLSAGLRAIGLRVTDDERSLVIHGDNYVWPEQREPVLLDAADDHRMAFAFALISLFVPNVRVLGASTVAKSWPTFWSALEARGATLASPA